MTAQLEIWKDVIGFEGIYQISNMGRLKALAIRKKRGRFYQYRPEKIIKSSLKRNGYASVQLQNNSIEKTISVHRLVAIHFVPNIYRKDQVNHINGIKTDNSYDNLEWCSIQENIDHSLSTGLKKRQRGEDAYLSKLKEADILFIRSSDLARKDLCKKFGVYKSTINKIKSRITWKHI